MDYSYLLLTGKPDSEKLKAFGFQQQGDSCSDFQLKKPLQDSGFYTRIELNENSITADVFDAETEEAFGLFNVASARGAFINQIRSQVKEIIDAVYRQCFLVIDVKARYESFLKSEWGTDPDFPWADLPEYAVYRCKNDKWYALIMHITFRQLGFTSREPVWVVNLKADPEKISALVDKKSVFPAYHMNKKNWITVLLTSVTDFETLCSLTAESKALVEK